MTIQELGQWIKTKAPQEYGSLSNEDAASSLITKYPNYQKYLVQQTQKKKTSILDKIGQFGGFLGRASGAEQLGQVASEFGKDIVQGTQGLIQGRRIGEGLSKERTKRIVGTGLQAAAGVSLLGGLGVGANALRTAATTGFISGGATAGESLEQGKGYGESFVSAIPAALTGAALSYGLSKAFSSAAGKGKKLMQRAEQLNLEATRPTGEIARQFEKSTRLGRKTLPQKMAEFGYKGTPREVVAQAETVRKTTGQQIGSILEGKTDIIKKGQIRLDVATEVRESVGKVLPNEMKVINKELSRLPDTLTLQEANNLKSVYAKRVNWLADPNSKEGMISKINRAVANSLRSRIEEFVPTIRKFNETWAVANDVSELASVALRREAQRPSSLPSRALRSLSGGLFGAPGRISQEARTFKRLTGGAAKAASKAAKPLLRNIPQTRNISEALLRSRFLK